MLIVDRFGLRRASKIAGNGRRTNIAPYRCGVYWPDEEISKQCGPKRKVLSKHPIYHTLWRSVSILNTVVMRDGIATDKATVMVVHINWARYSVLRLHTAHEIS